jgi:HPt (histidine-containing phosphotransfer) domain-containing protein
MAGALRYGAERDESDLAEDGAIVADETLAPLRDILPPAAFREILTLYEDTIRSTVATIAAAAGKADLPALGAAAHDLAGLCGQIGSGRCTALARQIETACRHGLASTALALAVEVGPAAAETLAALALYHDAPAEG